MDLKKFKDNISQNIVEDSFFIFLCEDESSYFLANQYIDNIARILNKEISYTNNIDSYINTQKSLFSINDSEISDKNLNIYRCDSFTDNNDKLKFAKNLIIITNKISDEVLQSFNYNIVKFPKLENWMIQDYSYVKGEGIDKEDLDYLCQACSYNIYRIENELDKLKDFGKTQRKYLFKQMVKEGALKDLSTYNIFALTNAIQSRDLIEISKILNSGMEIEPLALISLLYQNIRKMLMIWFDRNPTPESTGLKSNQIWAIKNLPRNYSKEQLINIFKFLTSLDMELKQGNLPTGSQLTEYVVSKILSI